MDKMDSVEKEQAEHHTYSRGKLESIEHSYTDFTRRLVKIEEETTKQDKRISKAEVVFATLSVVLSTAWAGITFLYK